MLIRQSNLPRLLAAAAFALVLLVYLLRPSVSPSGRAQHGSTLAHHHHHHDDDDYADRYNDPPRNMHTKATVVASLKNEDTSWLWDHLPEWQHNVYVVDDETAELTVLQNKGRESQAYLTYLIDNYHDLPEYMVFLHALRYQWHNEDPMYDGVYPLKNLQLPYVNKHGYANMRCTWLLGCPTELHPAMALSKDWRKDDRDKDRIETEKQYAQAFRELFPEIDDAPAKVGVPCGAQFAITRWKALERPRSDYVRMRDWLLDTELPDNVSGRVFEYSWHVVMGMPYITCPPAKECFCQKFGKCNLTCFDEGSCEGTYKLPKYSNLPDGWPEFGPGGYGFPAADWWKEWE